MLTHLQCKDRTCCHGMHENLGRTDLRKVQIKQNPTVISQTIIKVHFLVNPKGMRYVQWDFEKSLFHTVFCSD